MIHNLHLVGLGVTDPELDGVSRPTIGMGRGCHVRGKSENVLVAMLCKACLAALT
jgi:hypothetical protein